MKNIKRHSLKWGNAGGHKPQHFPYITIFCFPANIATTFWSSMPKDFIILAIIMFSNGKNIDLK